MKDFLNDTDVISLPLLPLRGLVVFPQSNSNFDVSREISKSALKEAMNREQLIILVSQKDDRIQDPKPEDLYSIGTFCTISQVLDLPKGIKRLLVKAKARAKIISIQNDRDYMTANAIIIPEQKLDDSLELKALSNTIKSSYKDYMNINSTVSNDLIGLVEGIDNPTELADIVAATCLSETKDKQLILSTIPLFERMEKLSTLMLKELELLKLEKKIQLRVKEQIDKNQKDYYLNEQIKSIQHELGNTTAKDIDELYQKLEAKSMNEEAKEKTTQELKRYSQMSQGSPEAVVSRTYIEYLLDLPWGEFTKDQLDINNTKNILNKNHYGLDSVKERIVEFVAVLNKKNNMRGPILCFVGPPGVGKTSIVRAISEALGRKFIQMSLGGVRDEAEIRGHRRTYVSAIPGRIIAGIKQGGTMNPLFLFDEIDKMASDFRGDPASAMLEVLDSEQNNAFRDHYLEIPFDLSNVMFITTANSIDTIPPALLDRLEIIEVSSYTREEKMQIAKRHLLSKQILEHGLKAKAVKISDDLIYSIIDHYTREAGVRQLERLTAKIVRKSIVEMLNSNKVTLSINETRLENFLGSKKYLPEALNKEPAVGMVNGLAYTSFGGVVLTVECVTLNGSGQIHLTGKLGEVMKESADAALSWVRAHAESLGLEKDFFKTTDIHIHVPEGAVPKDGPSAGVTIASAIISALTGKLVKQDLAMTGEITLRGNVLPIGGVKEKLFAAYRNNIYNVYIPKDNLKDLEELPKDILSKLNVIPVNTINDVINNIYI